MPQMADVTVKLADGVSNFLLNALQPAGPDGTAAVWRREDATRTAEQRVTAQVSARWNDKRNARVVQCYVRSPVLEDTSVSTVKKIIGYAECRDGRFVVPSGMTQTAIDDFAAIATNFMASALVRSSIASGFAPS